MPTPDRAIVKDYNIELKNCPFCAGKALALSASQGHTSYLVGCVVRTGNDCKVHPAAAADTLLEAIAMWNNRAELELI